MTARPLRLLICGYGLAGAAALALLAAGGGAAAAVAALWLGGAAATLGLAATPGLGRFFRAPTQGETAGPGDALARFEADRVAEAAAARAWRRTVGEG